VFTWLYTILRRTCARHRRQVWWRHFRASDAPTQAALDDVPSDEPSPPEIARANEACRAVRTLLKKLSPSLRDVLVLRYIEEFSVGEIARVLKIPDGTVKSRIHYALQLAALQWNKEQKE